MRGEGFTVWGVGVEGGGRVWGGVKSALCWREF